jgi:hypothetical protein
LKRFLIGLIFSLASCNTISTAPIQIQPSDVSSTTGNISDISYPISASKYVSLHADRTLRLNRSCAQVLRLNLVQSKGYEDTITELKNRAVLMGGNSVSLMSWRERGSKTILLGNIYMCGDKNYHIHPHPQT